MKSTQGDVRRTGVTDQYQHSDPHGVQEPHHDNARGDQQKNLGETACAPKEPDPQNAEDQHQADAFKTGARRTDCDMKGLAADGMLHRIDDRVGDEEVENPSHYAESQSGAWLPEQRTIGGKRIGETRCHQRIRPDPTGGAEEPGPEPGRQKSESSEYNAEDAGK